MLLCSHLHDSWAQAHAWLVPLASAGCLVRWRDTDGAGESSFWLFPTGVVGSESVRGWPATSVEVARDAKTFMPKDVDVT